MSENSFNNQVRSVLANYHPEVPASAYNGVRQKLWWSNFTKLSATRFNIWYLGILISGAATAWALVPQTRTIDTAIESQSAAVPTMVQPTIKPAATAEEPAVVLQSEAQNAAVKQNGSTVHPTTINEQHVEAKADASIPILVEEASNTPVHETKSEAQQSKGGAKRGLKVKTYSDGQQKK